MPDYYGIRQFTGKKGPKTYKAARGNSGTGNYGNLGGKPKTDKKLSIVDKKVKRVSNKVMRYKSKNPGPAFHDRY